MCAIIGFYTNQERMTDAQSKFLQEVFVQSKIRGLHAFGAATANVESGITVTKSFQLDEILQILEKERYPHLIGHCRYSTSGDWQDHNNNQPLKKNNSALVFNGVISMRTKEENEWKYNLKMETDNDGEIFLHNLERAELFVAGLSGSFAGLYYRDNELCFLRNNLRPAAYAISEGAVFIASTKDILRRSGFTKMVDLPAFMEINVKELL